MVSLAGSLQNTLKLRGSSPGVSGGTPYLLSALWAHGSLMTYGFSDGHGRSFGPPWVALDAFLALLGRLGRQFSDLWSKKWPHKFPHRFFNYGAILTPFWRHLLRCLCEFCTRFPSNDFALFVQGFSRIFEPYDTCKITFLLQTCRKKQGFRGCKQTLLFQRFFIDFPSISSIRFFTFLDYLA